MITVKRSLLSEDEVAARLDTLARRYSVPRDCYDDSAAHLMSHFDAMKWVSLCAQLEAAKRRLGMKASGPSKDIP
jgi:hypothetical protein